MNASAIPQTLEVPQTRPRARNTGLDFLRGIAIVLVLARHMTPPSSSRAVQTVMAGGWAGVDLFFVLSGFLVSGLLFREYEQRGKIDYWRFFWRRGLKIYPAFAVLLVGYGALEYFFGRSFTWKGVVGEMFFLQNYYAALWNHTWSLAIEEHFYLLAGIGITLLASAGKMNRVPFLAGLLCIGVLAIRLTLVWRFGGLDDYQTHVRMDSLMFGVLLSYLFNRNRNGFSDWLARHAILLPLALLSLVTLVVFPFGHVYWRTIGYTFLYLAFGIIVVCAVIAGERLHERGWARLIAFVGLNSYSIYLWHEASKRAFSLLRKSGLLVLPWALEFVGYALLSVAVGVVMAKLVEIPVLAWRDRKLPGNGPQLSPGS